MSKCITCKEEYKEPKVEGYDLPKLHNQLGYCSSMCLHKSFVKLEQMFLRCKVGYPRIPETTLTPKEKTNV